MYIYAFTFMFARKFTSGRMHIKNVNTENTELENTRAGEYGAGNYLINHTNFYLVLKCVNIS